MEQRASGGRGLQEVGMPTGQRCRRRAANGSRRRAGAAARTCKAFWRSEPAGSACWAPQGRAVEAEGLNAWRAWKATPASLGWSTLDSEPQAEGGGWSTTMPRQARAAACHAPPLTCHR